MRLDSRVFYNAGGSVLTAQGTAPTFLLIPTCMLILSEQAREGGSGLTLGPEGQRAWPGPPVPYFLVMLPFEASTSAPCRVLKSSSDKAQPLSHSRPLSFAMPPRHWGDQ